jgi:hypothetical protein
MKAATWILVCSDFIKRIVLLVLFTPIKRLLPTTKRLVVHLYQLKSIAVASFWGKMDSVGSSYLELNLAHVN